MKYYLIAGEASGDLHGANLMQQLKQQDPQAEFRYFGGDLMATQGGTLTKHYKDTAFMGLVMVLRNLDKVLGNMKLCQTDIREYNPDVVILIDYPSFNLQIAKYVKTKINKDLPVYFYISPKIWAWKEFRIKSIKKYVDCIFSILPFEVDYFKNKHSYDVTYVGNPSVDAVDGRKCKDETFEEFTSRNNLSSKPIVALLAGSRKAEITQCLPIMMQAAEEFPEYQFVVAGAPSISPELYETYLARNPRFNVVYGQTYNLLQQSTAALINSGTASLEAALLNVPQVVGYKVFGGKLARFVLQHLIKVKWASLVNLIAGRLVVKEYLADSMTAKNLSCELCLLLRDETYRQEMLAGYTEVRQKLGPMGASSKAAAEIIKSLKK